MAFVDGLFVRTKLNYNPPKADGSTYRIELQGISMPIMKQILDYIFSGEVSMKKQNKASFSKMMTPNCPQMLVFNA